MLNRDYRNCTSKLYVKYLAPRYMLRGLKSIENENVKGEKKDEATQASNRNIHKDRLLN